MSYLVMETHPAYVVVLDEQGRFLKAANQNYQVGQRLTEIIPFQPPKPAISVVKRSVVSLAGLAACLCLVFGGYFGYYQPNFTAYGSMLVQINPQVQLTLSQTHRVLGLEGLNQDGIDLIQDYDYQGKSGDTVVEELVQRAMEMGFLANGESVTLTADSQDGSWNQQQEDSAQNTLKSRYGDTIVIYLHEQPPQQDQQASVTLPASPQPAAPSQPASAPQPQDEEDDVGENQSDDWDDDHDDEDEDDEDEDNEEDDEDGEDGEDDDD